MAGARRPSRKKATARWGPRLAQALLFVLACLLVLAAAGWGPGSWRVAAPDPQLRGAYLDFTESVEALTASLREVGVGFQLTQRAAGKLPPSVDDEKTITGPPPGVPIGVVCQAAKSGDESAQCAQYALGQHATASGFTCNNWGPPGIGSDLFTWKWCFAPFVGEQAKVVAGKAAADFSGTNKELLGLYGAISNAVAFWGDEGADPVPYSYVEALRAYIEGMDPSGPDSGWTLWLRQLVTYTTSLIVLRKTWTDQAVALYQPWLQEVDLKATLKDLELGTERMTNQSGRIGELLGEVGVTYYNLLDLYQKA